MFDVKVGARRVLNQRFSRGALQDGMRQWRQKMEQHGIDLRNGRVCGT